MESKALIRDKFRKSVFERDKYQCVICHKKALMGVDGNPTNLDAHHIFDRKLFRDSEIYQGYVVDNGASLCSGCHIEAERCDISVEEIRHAAGITVIILPPGLMPGIVYDKWGQEVDESMRSRKYGRLYHFPFSPGAKNDDRINYGYWEDFKKMQQAIMLAKLDGENNCLSKPGVFARSHAAPTESKWTTDIRERWKYMKNDLGDLQIFLENLYAIHSIEYPNLDSHYYVFAVREKGRCLSWEEVKFYAELYDFPTVPVLEVINPVDFANEKALQDKIMQYCNQPEVFGSLNALDGKPLKREGVVIHNSEEYLLRNFEHNAFKWVTKGHVKTDEHWTKNWKRAKLSYEKNHINDFGRT